MLQRWLVKGFGILCACLYFLPVYAEQQIETSGNYKGALCVIRANDKLVLVREVITKQLSLPGGTVMIGEDSRLAAQRETWEETGIVVSVGKELGHTDKAVFFDCISPTEILAYHHQNALGGYELPVWFAPDYGIEVASATLAEPYEINALHYRYTEDWPNIIAMYEKATVQQVKLVADLVHKAPNFHQPELMWVQTLQKWVSGLTQPWNAWVHNLLAMGNMLASPITGIFLFPLLYWRCGKSVCYKVSFAISVTSLVCLFAQQSFSLPRPHVYFPSIQLITSYGNGFPSLPIAVWSCIGILLMTEKHRLGNHTFVVLYVVSAIWLTLSKFYLGSAFIIDMAVGGFVGLLITWNIIRFDIRRTERARTVMGSRRVWWGLTMVAALFTYFWQIPLFAAWLVVLVIMAVVTTVLRRQREYITLGQSLVFILVLVATYVGMSQVASMVSSSGAWSLIVETSRYPAIIMVFVALLRVTSITMNKTTKPS